MIGAGDLRERVDFQERAAEDDEKGNPESGEWVSRFERAARIRPVIGSSEAPGGREAVLADRLTGVQPYVITVRWSKDVAKVQSDWRIKDVRSGTIYAVRTVANLDERKKFVDFLCETGVAT